MTQPAPGFDDFWLASELNEVSRGGFLDRLVSFDPTPPRIPRTARSSEPVSLTRDATGLTRLLDDRHSERGFSDCPLPGHSLGLLLGAASATNGHRGYPAAGGLYSVGVTVACLNVDHPLNGQVAQYHPGQHALYPVGDCRPWEQWVDVVGGQDAVGTPAAVVLLWADPELVLAKYGERGGRFVLLEAGALLQSLSLVVAQLGLAGFAMGGSDDRAVLDLADLKVPSIRFVTAMAVGLPA